MNVKTASFNQPQAVKEFYYEVIDAVGGADDSVAWKKDIYPAPDFLLESICCGELFLAEEGGRIVGAMVLNHRFNDAYRSFHWPVRAEETEVTVIHALAIRPTCWRKGYAKQLVRFAIDYARDHHQKAIRLDVLKGNRNAGKLYAGMGFRYLHTLPMFYEDTGWADFDLYEYPLAT